MTRSTNSSILPDRLRNLTDELCRHAPESADRLAHAKTERKFLEVVCELFNLTSALTSDHYSLLRSEGLSKHIAAFISSNLHKELTLKLLALFLGYSEKYCSDFFQSTMGESFFGYLKRRRTDTASSLLATTDKSVAESSPLLDSATNFPSAISSNDQPVDLLVSFGQIAVSAAPHKPAPRPLRENDEQHAYKRYGCLCPDATS